MMKKQKRARPAQGEPAPQVAGRRNPWRITGKSRGDLRTSNGQRRRAAVPERKERPLLRCEGGAAQRAADTPDRAQNRPQNAAGGTYAPVRQKTRKQALAAAVPGKPRPPRPGVRLPHPAATTSIAAKRHAEQAKARLRTESVSPPPHHCRTTASAARRKRGHTRSMSCMKASAGASVTGSASALTQRPCQASATFTKFCTHTVMLESSSMRSGMTP